MIVLSLISSDELRLETSGPNSRCFRSSLTLISNPFPPGLGAGCYNVHPLFDGSTYYYGIETTADDVSQPSTSRKCTGYDYMYIYLTKSTICFL